MNCPMCNREMEDRYSERHHLTPRCKKGRETIIVCIDCGNQIHNIFSVKELAREYNTLEKLLAHPQVQKWVSWIGKKKDFGVCMKRKKKQ